MSCEHLDKKIVMKRLLLTSLPHLALLALVSGCAAQAKATIAPGTDLTALRTFHVVEQARDGRGIDGMLAEELVAMGYQATHGPEEACPDHVDAVVTYQDRWMWDITMYMIQLDVQIREPGTGMVLASGESMRTSLVRRSPPVMVREVLTKIFEAP